MKTMDRFVYQELFHHVLGAFYTGDEIDYVREVEYDGQFYENETFMIRDYDWNEDDEVGKNEYHFHHKPTDLKIYWYKYPMRSPKANFDVTPQQFLTVLYDCRNSLYSNITYNIDKHIWWNKETNENGVLELINQLDEPETLSEKWVDENATDFYTDITDSEMYVVFRLGDIQNLLAPNKEQMKGLITMIEELEQEIMELETELSEQYSYIVELENEYNDLDYHITDLQTSYEGKIKSLENELKERNKEILNLKYGLFTEKTRDSEHKFYWFTSKKRTPAHVVYSNSETQLFGFSEVPQYKFIEYHDLRFITNCSLDELIEQFR